MKLIVCLLALASLTACGHEPTPCMSVVAAPSPSAPTSAPSPTPSDHTGEGEDKPETETECEYVQKHAPKALIYFEGIVTND